MNRTPGGSGPRRISSLDMDRYLAGEGDPDFRTFMLESMTRVPGLTKEMQDRKDMAEGFLDRRPTFDPKAGLKTPMPWAAAADTLAERRRPSWSGRHSRPAVAFSLVAMAAILGFVLFSSLPFLPKENRMAAKGAAGWHLAVKSKDSLHWVPENRWACQPADTLQLLLVSGRPMYYAVLYRETGDKRIRRYLPTSDHLDALGTPEGEKVPRSIVLDSAWHGETLYCLASETPFDVTEAERLLEKGRALPAGVKKTLFLLDRK